MNKPEDLEVLNALKEKASYVDWFRHKRKEYFLLMSKSGFSPRLTQAAQSETIYLAQGFNLMA